MDVRNKYEPDSFLKFQGAVEANDPFRKTGSAKTYSDAVSGNERKPASPEEVDRLWEAVVKKPKGKKRTEPSKVVAFASDEVMLQRIVDTPLTPDSSASPLILQSVYGLVRKLGIRNRLASNYQLGHVPISSKDFDSEPLSKSGYYADLVRLGELKFGKSVPEDKDYGWQFAVDYDCFSALGKTEVASCATSNIREGITVRLFSKTEKKNRHPVTLVAAEVKRATYGNQFMNLLSINKPGREQLCRGLNLDKSDSKELGISVLQGVVKKATGSNRVTRYVKLWGYYLWLYHCSGAQKVETPAVNLGEYIAKTLTTIASELEAGGSTVMWVDKYTENSSFLALGLVEFPYFPLLSERGYCMFGGFSIPSEMGPKGVVHMLRLPGTAASVATRLRMTSIDAYKLICHYASSTQSYEDCQLGYVLAMALFTSNGLVNFSLPRSQGLADMFAPTYGLPVERGVPPAILNKYALLGTMVVAHQSTLMGKDMACYLKSGHEQGSGTEIQDCLSNVELRRAMYGLFRDKFFTSAFDLNYYIDPLAVADLTESDLLSSVDYTKVYWSVCSPSNPIRSSFMSYALSGYWLKLTEMASTDEQTLSTAVGVYVATGLIDGQEPDVCDIDGDAVLEKDEYSRLSRELLPGSFTMLPGVPEINLVELPRPDFSKAVPIGRSEPRKAREIRINYKTNQQINKETKDTDTKEEPTRRKKINLSDSAWSRLRIIDQPEEEIRGINCDRNAGSERVIANKYSDREFEPDCLTKKDCIEQRITDEGLATSEVNGSALQQQLDDDPLYWERKYPYLVKRTLQNQKKANETYISKAEARMMPQWMYDNLEYFSNNEEAEFRMKFEENRDGDRELALKLLSNRVDSTGRSIPIAVLDWYEYIETRLEEKRVSHKAEVEKRGGTYKIKDSEAKIPCDLYTTMTGKPLLEWQEYQWRRILGSLLFNKSLWRKLQPVYFSNHNKLEPLQAKWYGFGRLPDRIRLPTIFKSPLDSKEEFDEIVQAYQALESDLEVQLWIDEGTKDSSRVGDLLFSNRSRYKHGPDDPKMFVRLRRAHRRIMNRDPVAEEYLCTMIKVCR